MPFFVFGKKVDKTEEAVLDNEQQVADNVEVDAMTEQVVESVEVASAEPVEQPADEPVDEVAAEPVEEPVAEVVVDQVEEPAAEPVGQPVDEPVAEVVVEQVEESVAEQVAEPVEDCLKFQEAKQLNEQVRADIQVFANTLQHQLEQLTAVVLRQNELIYNLQSELAAKDELLSQQEDTIRMQSMRLEKFNDDILYKLQKPLIDELISIADLIRTVLSNDEIIDNKDFDALLGNVMQLKKWVAASLSNNSVKEYSLVQENPTSFDPKRQEISDSEITDDPAKDNTYRTDRPGYIWTMPYLIVNNEARLKRVLEDTKAPKMFEFIIRCEEVVKLKYRKPVETEQTPTEE